jgi:hypothetical protein
MCKAELSNLEKLSSEELKEIIGGLSIGICAEDIKNNNAVKGCICTYPNDPAMIENNNYIEGCLCKCTLSSSNIISSQIAMASISTPISSLALFTNTFTIKW